MLKRSQKCLFVRGKFQAFKAINMNTQINQFFNQMTILKNLNIINNQIIKIGQRQASLKSFHQNNFNFQQNQRFQWILKILLSRHISYTQSHTKGSSGSFKRFKCFLHKLKLNCLVVLMNSIVKEFLIGKYQSQNGQHDRLQLKEQKKSKD